MDDWVQPDSMVGGRAVQLLRRERRQRAVQLLKKETKPKENTINVKPSKVCTPMMFVLFKVEHLNKRNI